MFVVMPSGVEHYLAAESEPTSTTVWMLVVPERHVLFAFSHDHDSAAVDALLGDYAGHVVADAHSVYDHLYRDGDATEVACWSHARTYFFKVLGSEPEIAEQFLSNLRVMFLLERKFADKPRKQRQRMRAVVLAEGGPEVVRHVLGGCQVRPSPRFQGGFCHRARGARCDGAHILCGTPRRRLRRSAGAG